MSLSAAVIRELISAGLAGEALVTACERIEAASVSDNSPEHAADRRRAWDREYRRTKRMSGGCPPDNADKPVHPTSTRHPPDIHPTSEPLARVVDNNPSTEITGITTLHGNARAPEPLTHDELLGKLMLAGSPACADPARVSGMASCASIFKLLQANGHGPPCDLEMDILPVIRARCSSAKPNTIRAWSYFENAIIEARDTRLAGPPPMREANHERPPTSLKLAAKQANMAASFRGAEAAIARRREP